MHFNGNQAEHKNNYMITGYENEILTAYLMHFIRSVVTISDIITLPVRTNAWTTTAIVFIGITTRSVRHRWTF